MPTSMHVLDFAEKTCKIIDFIDFLRLLKK